MEEKNKKVIVPTIIAVVTLVILTVGATYAYFKVATDNNFGTPKIDASTPSIGSVALSTGANLTMNLTAEQMMAQWDDGGMLDDDGNPLETCDFMYYASSEGVQSVGCWGDVEYDVPDAVIGTASVTGEGSYTCTYTLSIDDNENSLYDKFQTGYANKSAGQIGLVVNGVNYDFNTAGLFPKTISGTMSGLTEDEPQYITAKLWLINDASRDQSNLSGQNITLTFGVEDFSCTAEEVEQEPQPAVQYILANASDTELWDSTLEDDGYRYVGTNPDNYVCFGYEDAEADCDFTEAANVEKYAYRVIGIFEDSTGVEHVKLIKNNPFTGPNSQDADYYDVNLIHDYFMKSTTYSYMQDDEWTNRIAIWNYIQADANSYDTEYDETTDEDKQIQTGIDYTKETSQTVYLHEMNRSSKTSTSGKWDTVSTKIGLMYVSDYLLSLGSSALPYTSQSNAAELKTGWMHYEINDLLNTTAGAGFGIYGAYISYYVDGKNGGITIEETLYGDVLRPVFYLTSDTTMNGTGTIENPFIVYK